MLTTFWCNGPISSSLVSYSTHFTLGKSHSTPSQKKKKKSEKHAEIVAISSLLTNWLTRCEIWTSLKVKIYLQEAMTFFCMKSNRWIWRVILPSVRICHWHRYLNADIGWIRKCALNTHRFTLTVRKLREMFKCRRMLSAHPMGTWWWHGQALVMETVQARATDWFITSAVFRN